jgi:hypothetical protein
MESKSRKNSTKRKRSAKRTDRSPGSVDRKKTYGIEKMPTVEAAGALYKLN